MLKIIYRDRDFIIVDKPAGFLVYGDRSTKGTPDCKSILLNRHRLNVLPVHRLDKETSGILAFALNPKAAHALTESLKSRQTVKTYLALTWGRLDGILKVDKPLKKNKSKDLEPATTTFRSLEIFNLEGREFTLVEAMPETGRYHQIRRHLSSSRHAIVGDSTYGPKNEKPLPREMQAEALHLCASRLKLQHPTSKKWMTFEADPSPKMQKALTFLKRNASLAALRPEGDRH